MSGNVSWREVMPELELLERELPMDVTFAFTVQEEVGTRGAFGAAWGKTTNLCGWLPQSLGYPADPRFHTGGHRANAGRGRRLWWPESGRVGV